MTTNKPEAVAYSWQCHGRHSTVDKKFADELVADGEVVDPLIRLSDYEALQDECDLLRKHLQNLIDQTTPLEPVPGNPMWSRRIQLDEVIAERDSLRAECEKLRKDADTERAIQRAAEVLPPGYYIEITVEKDGGDVALFGPGCSLVEIGFYGSLAGQIEDAIDAAMQGDQP